MGLFCAAFLIISQLFCIVSPLSAQTAESSSEEIGAPNISGVDESAIILGETPVAAVPASGSSVFLMLRMVLVLALAALAIYGVVFFIKRITRPQQSRDPHLKILAKVPISNDTFAAVLSVGTKAWLVAGGSGNVNLISEIDEVESLETMLLEDARRIAEAGSKPFIDFRSLLKRLGGGSRDAQSVQQGNSSANSSSLAESLRKQRERLKGL